MLTLGPLEIRAFTAWITLGVLGGAAVVLWAARRRGERLLPWLDALVGATIGAVIGARAFHVWLNWAYFAAHTEEILSFHSGGLDWHGALFGGLIGAALAARWRRLPLPALMDALALAVPIGALATWQACVEAACGYGLEVRSLADYPAWLVTESADIYGTVAPRLNLPPIGMALALAVLALVAGLRALGWLGGLRLWLALIVYSLGMALLSTFRAEYVPIWFGRRADLVLDLVAAVAATLIFVAVALRQAARKRRRAAGSMQQGDAPSP